MAVPLIGVPSPRLLRLPQLADFLAPWGRPIALQHAPGELAAIAVWRDGVEAATGIAEAARRGLPCLRLGRGFLGPARGLTWSLSVDDLASHDDSGSRSRIEALLAGSPAVGADTEALLTLIRGDFLGRDIDAPDLTLPEGAVVVLDQPVADPSVGRGGADASHFTAMLDAAVSENPGARIVVRRASEPGRGHLEGLARRRGIEIVPTLGNWAFQAGQAARVYTVTSPAGLDALVAGTRVTCFGLPFYAGWGLTDDRLACARRTARPSLAEFVAATYQLYCRYVDPVDQTATDAVTVARRLAALRRQNARWAGTTMVLGISRWKRPFVSPFLASPQGRVTFAAVKPQIVAQAARQGARLLVWAAREPDWLAGSAAASGVALARIEDGFLRSVGLGSDFIPALSLVVDDLGIYFDPTRESRLERLIRTAEMTPSLLDQADRLRRRLVEARLTKYNIVATERRSLALPPGRRVLLVPGQVEDDASIRLGAPVVKSNLALLEAVRAAAPDAVILYKPHPDVESGNRPGIVPAAASHRLADHVLSGWDAPSALDLAHEVHTMTSLLGFEALLRGRHVVTYGLPFYAGLGLTEDRLTWPRPRPAAALDRLIAATFLLYPSYREPRHSLPVAAFDVLALLEQARSSAGDAPRRAGRVGRWIELTLRGIFGR